MRWVFVGTPGFLGRVEGPTRCAFWSEDPQGHGFDPGLLVEIDLARTPSASAAGVIGWDQVQVDDCFTGPNGAVAGTTIGPAWPELRMSGAVYLEQRFVASLPAKLRPACPPTGASGRVYECLTTAYWPHHDDPRAGTRYAGHHAQIINERDTLAHVEIWPPGRSGDGAAPAARMWIDLTSPDQCDTGPDSLTTIGVGDAPKQGALFLISGHLAHHPEGDIS